MSKKIDAIPFSVHEALKERGISDERIERMHPSDMFNNYCEWNGLIGWGYSLWNIMEELNSSFDDAGNLNNDYVKGLEDESDSSKT